MLSYSAPPGYRRTKPVRRPRLDGFTGIVDAIRATKISPIDSRRASPISNRSSSRIKDGSCCRLTPRLGVRVVAY